MKAKGKKRQAGKMLERSIDLKDSRSGKEGKAWVAASQVIFYNIGIDD